MPPSLADFVAEHPGLDYDAKADELYLYHGTNCFRRWEILRTGAIEPGRSQYSFYCTKASDAYTYARAACMRDIQPYRINSLTTEPIVIKVRVNSRTWMQVDLLQELNPGDDDPNSLSIGILGPVSVTSIVDVLHCTHVGRRLGAGESIRSFEDGTLIAGIHHLKEKLAARRPDAWLMKKLGIFSQRVGTQLSGGEVPDLTDTDYLRRLKQSHVQA